MNKAKLRAEDLETLVHTTNKRDAELTVSILNCSGFSARVVEHIEDLLNAVGTAGAIVIAEDVLTPARLADFKNIIDAQPTWSDIPVILVAGGSAISVHNRLESISRFFQSLTVLEKPIRLATLITVVRSALSSRVRQFEQRRILQDLQEAKRAAESASHAKSSFLAHMSHEIRTPLAAIIGFTGLVRDPALEPLDRQKYLDIISRNSDQLSQLVNDVLNLSKIEAGGIEIENSSIEVASLMKDLENLLGPFVESKGLEFAMKIPSDLPNVIESDKGKIRQIVVNLVANAAKFTEQGSVHVEVRKKDVNDDVVQLEFDVLDTGIGIELEKQENLFKAFSQADESITRRFGGTGLGLTLSKKFANALGGDVQLVHSTPNKGSCFRATLKAHVISAPLQRQKSQLKCTTPDLNGAKILLVEDSIDNRLLIQRYLTNAHAEVETATNGHEGLSLARTQKFDLILMDIQMPVMDGLTAARGLREQGFKGPMIALTAHALKEERGKSIDAGFNEHITKPIATAALIDIVASHLRRQT